MRKYRIKDLQFKKTIIIPVAQCHVERILTDDAGITARVSYYEESGEGVDLEAIKKDIIGPVPEVLQQSQHATVEQALMSFFPQAERIMD